jgi:hypothetical protein
MSTFGSLRFLNIAVGCILDHYFLRLAIRMVLVVVGYIVDYYCVTFPKGIVHMLRLVILSIINHICGVMVSVLASSAVQRWFEPLSGQTKDFYIGIGCCSAKYAALRRKSKDGLARTVVSVT